MKFCLFLICTLFVLFRGPALTAQDGHYWTQHYGTKSILLSNSAIGGVNDLAAVYYNPGRMGLIEQPAFLLNTNVFEVSRIKFKDIVGDQGGRAKTELAKVPSFVAGTFRLGFLKGHHFGYSILQRQDVDIDFNFRTEVLADVIEQFPGQEYFGTNIGIKQKLKEDWISLTWAYPLSDRFSVGVTTSLTRLSSEKGTLIELQALTESSKVVQYQFDRAFSINDFGVLWKLGIAGENRTFNWGLTLTTPSLQIGGKGNYDYYEFFSGIDSVSVTPDRFTTSHQEDIKTQYKRPLAIGGGISIPIGKSALHLSSEWYNSIPQYTLMEAESHVSQSDGDTISFALVDNLKSVTNFGIGAEFYINEKLSTYLSASTDFSAASDTKIGFIENQPEATNTVFTTNFYHFSTGVSFSLKRADITLGTAYTSGTQDFARPVNLPEDGDVEIFENGETGSFKWSRLRLVFSFSFPFGRDVKNGSEGSGSTQ